MDQQRCFLIVIAMMGFTWIVGIYTHVQVTNEISMIQAQRKQSGIDSVVALQEKLNSNQNRLKQIEYEYYKALSKRQEYIRQRDQESARLESNKDNYESNLNQSTSDAMILEEDFLNSKNNLSSIEFIPFEEEDVNQGSLISNLEALVQQALEEDASFQTQSANIQNSAEALREEDETFSTMINGTRVAIGQLGNDTQDELEENSVSAFNFTDIDFQNTQDLPASLDTFHQLFGDFEQSFTLETRSRLQCTIHFHNNGTDCWSFMINMKIDNVVHTENTYWTRCWQWQWLEHTPLFISNPLEAGVHLLSFEVTGDNIGGGGVLQHNINGFQGHCVLLPSS